jgi:hypothetical protein
MDKEKEDKENQFLEMLAIFPHGIEHSTIRNIIQKSHFVRTKIPHNNLKV